MKPRTTLLLLALLGLGIVVYAIMERRVPSTDERIEEAERALPGLDPETLVAFEISAPDAEPLRVRRASPDAPFVLEEPLVDVADDEALSTRLADLAALRSWRRLALGELEGGLVAAGLDERARVVTFRAAGGETKRYRLGAEELPGGYHYLLAEGEEVARVVGSDAARLLRMDPAGLRERALVPLSTLDVCALEITSGAAGPVEDARASLPLAFERRGEDWWARAPFEDDADDEALTALLEALSALRAERFVEGLEESPLPSLRVALSLCPDADPPTMLAPERDDASPAPAGAEALAALEGAPLLVEFAPAPGAASDTLRRATRSGRPAWLEVEAGGLLRELAREPASWREPLAFSAPSWEVAALEIEREGQRVLRVERTRPGAGEPGQVWRLAAPEEGARRLDEEAFQALLERLARVPAERLAPELDPAEVGLDAPRFVVRVEGREEARFDERALAFGAPAEAGLVHAQRLERPLVTLVDATLLEALDPETLLLAEAPQRGEDP